MTVTSKSEAQSLFPDIGTGENEHSYQQAVYPGN